MSALLFLLSEGFPWKLSQYDTSVKEKLILQYTMRKKNWIIASECDLLFLALLIGSFQRQLCFSASMQCCEVIYTVSFVFRNNQCAAIHFPYKLSLASTRSLLPLTITQWRWAWCQARHYNVMVMNHLLGLFGGTGRHFRCRSRNITNLFFSSMLRQLFPWEMQTNVSLCVGVCVCVCEIAGGQQKIRWHLVLCLHQTDSKRELSTDRQRCVCAGVCGMCCGRSSSDVTHAALCELFNVFPEALLDMSGNLSVQTLLCLLWKLI